MKKTKGMKKKKGIKLSKKYHKIIRKIKEQRKYRIYCKLRYYIILFAYIFQYLVTLLLCNLTIPWKYILFKIHIPVKLLSIVAMTVYLVAKWYLLKNTKFRKRDFFNK